jgi:ribosomal protein S18 acetylase RimI-like enzyme
VTVPETTRGPVEPAGLDLVPTGYDDEVVRALDEEVQQTYVERYGGRDETPMSAGQFAPPRGHFVVGYVEGQPVAMGGWRHRSDAGTTLPGKRPAEIKRMFVREHARGRGLGRRVLAELERAAGEAGVDWLVLETGERQPEAIGLYRSAGYRDIGPFGVYADEADSVYLGKRL